MLINMDPPQHTRYRRLISRAFAARAIERLEPAIREIARDCLARVRPGHTCDFVEAVAAPLPNRVIFELLGVPLADRDRLIAQANVMIDQSGTEAALGAAMGTYSYALQLAAERRRQPGDDLVTQLVRAEVDGERLSDPEITAFFLLLVVAGTETTRNLISGGLVTLLENPGELSRMRADRALLPSAIEEMLRHVSPVTQFRRTANRDAEFQGQKLREGDMVVLAHASANRDEAVFADPDRFDVGRAPNPHLAFGLGAHLCIGAALARMEGRVLYEELLARFGAAELDGAAVRVRSNFINGYRHLPVRFASP